MENSQTKHNFCVLSLEIWINMNILKITKMLTHFKYSSTNSDVVSKAK